MSLIRLKIEGQDGEINTLDKLTFAGLDYIEKEAYALIDKIQEQKEKEQE